MFSNCFRESGGFGVCAQRGPVQIRKTCFCWECPCNPSFLSSRMLSAQHL